MKNYIAILLFFGFTIVTKAQVNEKDVIKISDDAVKIIEDTIKNGWHSKGKVTLLFNQSSFSNWVPGGENSFSGNLGLDYKISYKKNNFTWDNRIFAAYGLLQTQNSTFQKKTDDQLEINSLFAQKDKGNWYYSFVINFRTQFTSGYFYSQDANGAEQREENTNFMSPGYLLFGPGMFWKKTDNLKLNFAPLTSRLTFVDSYYTSVPGYVNGSYFGVDANKSVLYELGFNIAAYYKFTLMENVTAENILSLYSNYLKDPQNVDLYYTLNVVMKVNKVLSANFTFQTIYDNNAFSGFQIREIFGLGVNYSF